MLLERSTETGSTRLSPLAYHRRGRIFEGRLPNTLIYYPAEESVGLSFHEWLERRYGDVQRPWLEFPFREYPFQNPTFSRRNIDEDANYYFVVQKIACEFGATRFYVTSLFIPGSTSVHDVARHLARTFHPRAGLYGVRTDLGDAALTTAA